MTLGLGYNVTARVPCSGRCLRRREFSALRGEMYEASREVVARSYGKESRKGVTARVTARG